MHICLHKWFEKENEANEISKFFKFAEKESISVIIKILISEQMK